MDVVMVGSGYVGLVSGACFAEFGADVVCIDKDESIIESLKQGVMPIYEPGLDELVEKNVGAGRLIFTTGYTDAVAKADLIFIAVGTPTRRGNGYADLSYVYQAAKDIAPYLEGFTVIVDKSTVPVGTARNVERIIREENPDADFNVASNPEFLREGAATGLSLGDQHAVVGRLGRGQVPGHHRGDDDFDGSPHGGGDLPGGVRRDRHQRVPHSSGTVRCI